MSKVRKSIIFSGWISFKVEVQTEINYEELVDQIIS